MPIRDTQFSSRWIDSIQCFLTVSFTSGSFVFKSGLSLLVHAWLLARVSEFILQRERDLLIREQVSSIVLKWWSLWMWAHHLLSDFAGTFVHIRSLRSSWERIHIGVPLHQPSFVFLSSVCWDKRAHLVDHFDYRDPLPDHLSRSDKHLVGASTEQADSSVKMNDSFAPEHRLITRTVCWRISISR